MSIRLFRSKPPARRPQPVWLPPHTPRTGLAAELAAAACQTCDPFTRATLNDLAPRVARLEISLNALSPEPAGVVL